MVQSFTDAPLTDLRVVRGPLRKVYAPVGIVFKGSGFYKTDSRSSSTSARPEGAATSSDGAGGGRRGGLEGRRHEGLADKRHAGKDGDGSRRPRRRLRASLGRPVAAGDRGELGREGLTRLSCPRARRR